MASSSVCDRSCASASSGLSIPVSVSALYPAVSCSENRTGVPACAANSLSAALSEPASICMGTDKDASVSCALVGCVPANRPTSKPTAAPWPSVLVIVTDPLRSSPACPMQPVTRDNKLGRREGIINPRIRWVGPQRAGTACAETPLFADSHDPAPSQVQVRRYPSPNRPTHIEALTRLHLIDRVEWALSSTPACLFRKIYQSRQNARQDLSE